MGTTLRYRPILALVIIVSLAASADACHGLLRRLIGPRDVCCPPPVRVVVEQKPVAKEPEVVVDTLEGRVVWVGELPKVAANDESLLIDSKSRGVANVAIFLKRAKDGVMPILPNDKIRKDTIGIDSPSSAFVPHMVAYYPMWHDGKDRGITGQKLVFKNSSKIAQNVRTRSAPKFNQDFNKVLVAGTQFEATFNPQPLPVQIVSDLHPSMAAWVWVFDHPYFAITKSDGTFRIPRVPAGMEVQVMAWHESQGWLLTKEGKTMQLKKGANVLQVTMGADNNK